MFFILSAMPRKSNIALYLFFKTSIENTQNQYFLGAGAYNFFKTFFYRTQKRLGDLTAPSLFLLPSSSLSSSIPKKGIGARESALRLLFF